MAAFAFGCGHHQVTAMREHMISITQLSVRYRRGKSIALRGVDLSVPRGMYGLLGPNGAGKTTLLRVLATLLKPSSGDAQVAGYSVRHDRLAIRRLLGYIPQESGFYPQLRVWETLDYLALLSGLTDTKYRKKRIHHVLTEVNLTDYVNRRVKTLSGGMRKRLGIAQALVHDPQIIIADEPTVGLDPEERVRMRALLARLAADHTVIISTHIVSDIASVCPQLAVLHRGQIIFAGPTQTLADQARGQLWQVTIPDDEVGRLMQGRWPVARLTQTSRGTLVRIVAPHHEGYLPVEEAPSLEEGYLALIGKEEEA